MKTNILLLITLATALIIRLVGISSFPSGLNADEAALGYNAYSIMLTGKDEHSNPFPVNLQSFDDYKPALYAYLLIPFIKIFGLTVFAVRLPSALIGVLLVYLVFKLAYKLFSGSQPISLLSALYITISPWAIHFSRGGWEVNLSAVLIVSGLIYLLNWLKSNRPKHLLWSTLFFSLSLYSYQSARIMAPLLVISILLRNYKIIKNRFNQLFYAVILSGLVLIPLLVSFQNPAVSSRLSGVGLLADQGPINRVNELRGQHSASTYFLAKILHNRPVIFTLEYISNYLDHFNPDFLFIKGDEVERSKVPETGVLYLFDWIFIVVGIFILFNHKVKGLYVIIIWLLLSPIASALTFQTPSALRAFYLVIFYSLVIPVGIIHSIKVFPDRIRVIPVVLIVTSFIFLFVRYLHMYYVHYPRQYPSAWQFGFDQLSTYLEQNSNRYKQVLITNRYDQPYIITLFFSRYPPQIFQSSHILTPRDKYNFSTVTSYDKFIFTDTSWEKVRDIHDSLIVASPQDIPMEGVNVVHTIYFPNMSPAFKIISN